MIEDISDVDDHALIETDVCIIGAGAAGITLALELAHKGREVTIFESGGEEREEAIQALYSGSNSGQHEPGLSHCRLRFLGGTTNHWGGKCGPLNALDFEPRAWVADSGWPLSLSDLDPWYRIAHSYCELAEYRYDTDYYRDASGPLPAFDDAKLLCQFYQFSPPTRFGRRYRDALSENPRIRLILHGNITELVSNEAQSRITGAKLRTLNGKQATVKASDYVVACGALENARLLLLSGNKERGGLGNLHDNVGRYFMQHPHHHHTATVTASEPEQLAALLWDYRVGNTRVNTTLSVSDSAQAANEILNFSALIYPDTEDEPGFRSLYSLIRHARERRMPDNLGTQLKELILDIDSAIVGTYEQIVDGVHRPPIKGIKVYSQSEQAPNRNSRVVLNTQTDALGQQQLDVQWRLQDIDLRTLRESNRLIGEEFGRLGLGRLQLAEWLREEYSGPDETLWGGCHHMGTTRMSSRAKLGVVDADCRVHGSDNLFIAGSSVFPTVGYANPTLTLVALAARLADHLSKRTSA